MSKFSDRCLRLPSHALCAASHEGQVVSRKERRKLERHAKKKAKTERSRKESYRGCETCNLPSRALSTCSISPLVSDDQLGKAELNLVADRLIDASNQERRLITYLEGKLGLENASVAEKLKEKVASEDFGGDRSLIDLAWAIADEGLLPADFTRDSERSDAIDEYMRGEDRRSSAPAHESISENESEFNTQSSKESPSRLLYKAPHSRQIPPNYAKDAFRGPFRAKRADIESRIRSLFNRVSEGNLNILLKEIVEVVAEENRSVPPEDGAKARDENVLDGVDLVSHTLVAVALSFLKVKTGASLIAPQMAMLSGVSGIISPKIVYLYTTRCLELYEKSSSEVYEGLGHSVTDKILHTAFDTSLEQVEVCRQAIHSLCILFYFGLINICIFMAFLDHLCGAQAEEALAVKIRRLDFLVLVLRLTGSEIRTRHPDAFKDVVFNLTKMLAELADVQTMHIDFLRHELEHVGRPKKAPIYEKLVAMKNWLTARNGVFKSVNWDMIQVDSDNPHASLRAMLRGELPSDMMMAAKTTQVLTTREETADTGNLLKVAKLMNIKTPLQQQAFIAISSADSIQDAAIRLNSLVRTRKQLPFLVAVILYCAVQERVYNPFYEELCLHLCQSSEPALSSRYVRAFRQGLHSLVGSLEDRMGPLERRKKAVAAKITLRMVHSKLISSKDSLLERYK